MSRWFMAAAIAIHGMSVVASAGAGGHARALASASQADTNAAQKATFETVCGTCHESNQVEGPFRSAAEWQEAIDRMKSYGATASDAQFAEVRSYVLRHHGKVNVNRGTADELGAVLDLTDTVAESVVSFRTANGKFATLDDLKKVPGLDPQKVDARKARLGF